MADHLAQVRARMASLPAEAEWLERRAAAVERLKHLKAFVDDDKDLLCLRCQGGHVLIFNGNGFGCRQLLTEICGAINADLQRLKDVILTPSYQGDG